MTTLADLEGIPINTLFVQSILRGHVDGEVYARDGAYYAVHPYGMSFLWGEPRRGWIAERLLRATPRPEWLQVYPMGWAPIVEAVLGASFESGAALRSTRVNFAFDGDAYRPASSTGATVVPASAAMFAFEGGVVPSRFWRDADHFVRDGGGYGSIVDGEVAALAFVSYRHGRRLEIGIETAPRFRGKGHARLAASALIESCLRRELEPVWACRYENVASYRLALSLGFVPTAFLPYYRLALAASN